MLRMLVDLYVLASSLITKASTLGFWPHMLYLVTRLGVCRDKFEDTLRTLHSLLLVTREA